MKSIHRLIYQPCVYIVLLLMTFSAVASQQSADQMEVTYQDDLTLLKQALSTAHPGYSRYLDAAQLEGHWSELQLRVNDPDLSELQFYVAVSKLLAALRCDHTKAEFSQSLKAQKETRFLPFTFVLFNQQMFVENSIHSDLKRGDEITHINGISIAQAIVQLQDYVAVDGYTTHVINRKLEHDSDLLGSGFEQFFAPVVLGTNNYPESYQLVVNKKDTEEATTFEVNTISFKSWLTMSSRPYRLDFKDAVTVELIADTKTAVLTVDTFVNYRYPVDAMALFGSIFKELRDKEIQHLIVDLRANGGGSDDAQLALMRHLYNQPFQIVTGAWLTEQSLGELAKQLSSWDRTVIEFDKTTLSLTSKGYAIPVEMLGGNATQQVPADYAFQGNITLLSSSRNASASGALMAHMKQTANNVNIVGEPTGGNQGGTTATVMSFLKLPASGISVRVPLIRNQYNISNPDDGLGAVPDIMIMPSYNDWLANRDRAMITAKALNNK